MNELALFAGAGGGILGGHLLGWRTVCAVEFEPYAASVLVARQNDGILPPFPIWDDVRTFDGRPWRGLVDVVSGGFPCQDISAAGNGAGIDGERSGLWREMARIIGEVRPRFVFVENSPLLVRRGLAMVLGDLTELGYDATWCVMGAADVGAPHQRDRIWIVANAACEHGEARDSLVQGPHRPASSQPGRLPRHSMAERRWRGNIWPECPPGIHRMGNGISFHVDRLKALGNGQVPRVAAAAFSYLASDWI
ncbi:TPA: DNA cytosine methyltransferase [Pseudomonas aeruginosa]|nr:DNA cytosine methyltransferase [Pseudomonas aeruginosa]